MYTINDEDEDDDDDNGDYDDISIVKIMYSWRCIDDI